MEKEKKADKITLYMLLGVNEKATENEIRKAYKKSL
jgi:curved DNA-binding protein CbpA